jgi:ornithine cyclodeaminase/alanine dehydrogenase
LLKRKEVAALLGLGECIAAVEQAFGLHGEGKTLPPGILGMHFQEGAFHIKAAELHLSRPYFAVKTNGNFFQNMKRFGMPNIQGVIILCDADNGYPLAVMDSIEITITRTGAATAVAAKHLARPDSKIVTICGCGNQGRVQLRALAQVLGLERAYAFDNDEGVARRYADDLSAELRIDVKAVRDLGGAVGESDICVTCTPSKQHFLSREYVAPGTFIAAVGADGADKQELDPRLMASGKVVADILDQCATIGDLHHAIEAGLVTRADVYAELGEVVAGKKPGRESRDETIIFDSTGTALQDVAAAAIVYEKAASNGIGLKIDFSE